MDTHHVDSNTISVWRLQAAIFALVISVPFLIVAMRAPGTVWLLLPVAYGALAAYCIWVLPPAHYDALAFGVDEQGIVIQRGIFWRSRIALPRFRVQHTDVSQGPLQRRFGVATLKLYTAGSRYTKIELPGLTHDDALALRDALLARGGDSGV
jgi:uncharacterized protein